MIQLNKVIDLPSTITVKGRPYQLQTDFQHFINFSNMLQEEHTYIDYDIMYKGEVPEDRVEGLNQIKMFAFPTQTLPRDLEEDSDEIILSYEEDEDLIYSAFMQCYGIDLKAPNLHLHWYKFRALLNGITNTKLNKVMEWRSYVPNEKESPEYRKYMQKMKATWKIERKLSKEEQDVINEFDSQLK